MGAVDVVLTAPYLSDSGGSGIITPLLFIKLKQQSQGEHHRTSNDQRVDNGFIYWTHKKQTDNQRHQG